MRALARPLREFLQTETAGAAALFLATLIALALANSPVGAGYESLWKIEWKPPFLGPEFELDLRHWVNEGLMTIFFFVVGLEIKRELVVGELKDPRKAALPVIAAVGGVAVPALVYLAINTGEAGERGWGIPTATDIAFAVGVLTILGSRVPSSLKVFLLSLAIVDDVLAIVVIAIFYSSDISMASLAIAIFLAATMVAARRLGVERITIYVALGAGMWAVLIHSGIHPTLAGVTIALITPVRPSLRTRPTDESVAERLQRILHPGTSYLIVPVFALANAGVELSGSGLRAALGSPIAAGIVMGLVMGKVAGITAASWIAVRLKVASLPSNVDWSHIVATSALAGIGFTVSLFIATLAFDDPELIAVSKIGILAASLLAATIGSSLLLVRSARNE